MPMRMVLVMYMPVLVGKRTMRVAVAVPGRRICVTLMMVMVRVVQVRVFMLSCRMNMPV